MPHPFDAGSKQLFDDHVRDWLTLAGWPVPADDAGLVPVDSDLSVVSAAVDKLIRVELPSGPYLAHVDFQSSPAPRVDRRMAMYAAIASARHGGLPVRTLLVLLRPAADAGVTGRVCDRFGDRSYFDFAYEVLRVWLEPAERFLTGSPALLPLAPIAAVPRGELPNVARIVRQRPTTDVPPDQAKTLAELTRVMMGLGYTPDVTEALMATLADIFADSSTYQATLKIGREEGILIGIAEGVTLGRAAGARQILRAIATARFGPPSPAAATRLAALSADDLDRLAPAVSTANGWDDLLAH